jgi:hypothetical protein
MSEKGGELVEMATVAPTKPHHCAQSIEFVHDTALSECSHLKGKMVKCMNECTKIVKKKALQWKINGQGGLRFYESFQACWQFWR